MMEVNKFAVRYSNCLSTSRHSVIYALSLYRHSGGNDNGFCISHLNHKRLSMCLRNRCNPQCRCVFRFTFVYLNRITHNDNSRGSVGDYNKNVNDEKERKEIIYAHILVRNSFNFKKSM